MNSAKIIRRIGIRIATRLGLYERRQLEYFKIVTRMLITLVKHVKNCVVLDLGCGNGWLTRSMSRFCGLAIGIDIAPSKRWSSGDRGSNVEFVVADARFLPIRSNAISFVVALSLLEHVTKWSKVVSEAFRVPRRGALFIVQIPNLSYFIEPHTKFPILGFLPNRLRTMLALTMCCEIHFDCTLKNVIRELEKHDFKYWVSPYYHIPHKLILFPPAFFIIALKKI
ncbi:MAG: hypothetical protein DRO40_04345 [Thermoprotei archaeon]|nr:MAG: hypothetical protein DRO40_04345 [Thermoprotei archaeon]